ncbi:ABC transporter permease [Sporomusa termitida]|uniref:ADOP: acidobacterial duplicated orphan permease n=1 Tax=Sporomusa termitida TaxID=2377 RepID=A0A517DUD6_9FIRM|nr:ABC transporter permease [Sporomusa termitida]QDR80973.1 ADOP: acidobacterial duplicated orphan permease [Sporomusa termitida]
MIHLLIAWRNLCQKSLTSLLAIAVVSTAVAMTIIVMLLASSLRHGLVLATEPFDLIAGAKGSPNQLVLNTVFLQDVPIGNIDYSLIKKLSANPLVESVIPLGFGDNYHGYRLVGTEQAIFEHRSRPGQFPWLQLDRGKPFQAEYEAVIGAKVAKDTGLTVGAAFASAHGVTAGGQGHGSKQFTVVGIMKPVLGPYDQAILVPLTSLWAMHQHEPAGAEQHAAAIEAEHDHEHDDQGTTAILIKPRGYAEAMSLYQQFQKDTQVQVVFPSQVIARLFSVLSDSEQILKLIGFAAFAMTLLLVAFALYWSALIRSRDRAILRAIGGSWQDLAVIVLLEGLMLVWSGILTGVLLGHGVFSCLASILQQKTAIAAINTVSPTELVAIAAVLLTGVLASIIPALCSAKMSISADL